MVYYYYALPKSAVGETFNTPLPQSSVVGESFFFPLPHSVGESKSGARGRPASYEKRPDQRMKRENVARHTGSFLREPFFPLPHSGAGESPFLPSPHLVVGEGRVRVLIRSNNTARPCLQLMPSESQLDLTAEQREICRAVADAAIGAAIKVQAFAGTGKTTTLAAVARACPRRRFLYVVFNRAAAADARRKMPPNVGGAHRAFSGLSRGRTSISQPPH